MYKVILLLLLISSPLYADICGDVSIGKSDDTYKGRMKIGYDFSMGDIKLIPFIDYINYFNVEGLSGHPYRDIFGVGVKLEYSQVYILVKHECSHEVSSLNSRGQAVLYSDAEENKSSTYITVGYHWGRKF